MTLLNPGHRYFATLNGVEVSWSVHTKSCLYHATYDGKAALCGAPGALEPITQKSTVGCAIDPSCDLMTCVTCAGLVRRVKSGGEDWSETT